MRRQKAVVSEGELLARWTETASRSGLQSVVVAGPAGYSLGMGLMALLGATLGPRLLRW